MRFPSSVAFAASCLAASVVAQTSSSSAVTTTALASSSTPATATSSTGAVASSPSYGTVVSLNGFTILTSLFTTASSTLPSGVIALTLSNTVETVTVPTTGAIRVTATEAAPSASETPISGDAPKQSVTMTTSIMAMLSAVTLGVLLA
ncbi:uncharacterized protein L969DRAFT_104442 [Mixia osmundae IAM 14324]|uniref:REJ domain-containing protein n=1 Tax=Mixia osmundae (strain CBS 9802 / IAM 14324 / JCM 22182 / KY 12970) TaxID=764103 RepID=G7E830_MIXOS|nr:uncharacterized protein L969DRAFT_104442 [Mixia osmundae IAM 14324]KEI38590.1 hypothetical protein L969DRAFT_104442 [Mixia osmundae IAM 14324]GAA98990.1 hypothetical protein E5Q_05679 [Mixia osmundae IAM 14324]